MFGGCPTVLIRSGTVTVPSVFVFSLEIGSRLLNPLRRFSSNWAALLCASGLAATCANGYSVSSSVLCVSGAWNPSVFCSTEPHYGVFLTWLSPPHLRLILFRSDMLQKLFWGNLFAPQIRFQDNFHCRCSGKRTNENEFFSWALPPFVDSLAVLLLTHEEQPSVFIL